MDSGSISKLKRKENNMTANEAFDFGLSKIDELQQETGVVIKIIPYDFTKFKDGGKHEKELKEKYSGEECADHNKWCRIHFSNPTDEQKEKIRELGNYLNMCGISSDQGGCAAGWDWEWDWSFKYVGKDNEEAREMRDQMYGLFKECGF